MNAEMQRLGPASPEAVPRPLTKIERVGRGVWLMLHLLAERLKQDPLLYRDLLQETIDKVLPCPICQADAREYLQSHPIGDETHPPLWICRFHNHVNLKLRKQVFPCEPQSAGNPRPGRTRCWGRSSQFVESGYYLD